MERTRRIRRDRPAASPAILARIQALVSAVAQNQEEAAAASARAKTALGELETAMKAAGLKECRAGDWVGELFRSPGRKSNIIDPKKFRQLVKDDKDFFSAISVSVTEAKKILPERTLDSITTEIPGKVGPETVRVVKVK